MALAERSSEQSSASEAVSARVAILAPEGRIDNTVAPSLEAKLLSMVEQGARYVIMDMARIGYISSAGFRVLLVAGKAVDGCAGRLVLCALAPEIRRLFDLSGFSELFTIVDSRAEAQVVLA